MDPRDYLLDRFQSDSVALHARAVALRSGPAQPGPDATTSARMAEACDDVVAMLAAVPPTNEAQDAASDTLAALRALIPELERRAVIAASLPPVRAVYAGAATRIREIEQAESTHLAQQTDDVTPGDPDS